MKFLRDHNPITIVLAIIAIAAPIMILVALMQHPSTPSYITNADGTVSVIGDQPHSVTPPPDSEYPSSPQAQRVIDAFNRYSGQFDSDSFVDSITGAIISLNGHNGNFSNRALASMLSDLGFPSSVYNNIVTHHYINPGDHLDPNAPKACSPDYQVGTSWASENPNLLVVGIDSRWLYGFPTVQPCR